MPRLDLLPRADFIRQGAIARVWKRWFANVYEVIRAGNVKEVTFHDEANGDLVDQSFFIANRAYQVVAVQQVHSTLGSDGSAVNLQITKDTGTTTPGAGTNLLTNNSDAGFNLKSTVNTVQEGALSLTLSDLQLAKGDRLSVDFAGTLTAVAGISVTVSLRPLAIS